MTIKKRTALDNLLPPLNAASAEEKNEQVTVRAGRSSPSAKVGKGTVATTAAEQDERENKKLPAKHEIVKQMLYLPLPVAEQLRTLHFEEQRGQAKRIKLHDYFLEAINLLFKNRGVKSIEDLTKSE